MSIKFGKKLKELRKEKTLSQKKLSEYLACSQSVLCDWENGKAEPTENNIIKLAVYFDISADYLLGLETEEGVKIYNNYGQDFRNAKFEKSTININSKKE